MREDGTYAIYQIQHYSDIQRDLIQMVNAGKEQENMDALILKKQKKDWNGFRKQTDWEVGGIKRGKMKVIKPLRVRSFDWFV